MSSRATSLRSLEEMTSRGRFCWLWRAGWRRRVGEVMPIQDGNQEGIVGTAETTEAVPDTPASVGTCICTILTCSRSFPMKQGVLQQRRVRLLLSKGHSCYRPRRTGERVRKSVRGCIVGNDIAVLAVAVVKQGDADIPGLTDNVLPKRLGPKRATKVSYYT